MRPTAASLLVAALVMLAGCAGGVAGPNGTQANDGGDSGTVSFYVSDEENAIGQFEHLNVTVTNVGFAQTADADVTSGGWTVETEAEDGLEVSLVGNLTAGADATVNVTHDGEPVENATVEADDADVRVRTDADGTATVAVPADAEEVALTASTDGDSAYGETEATLEAEYEEADGGDETQWVERDVDSRTVDLTELQGANATLLGNMSVPAGEYETVFVHVDDVQGTLESGEEVNVKLPSRKLHLNENVAVESDGSVDFVFDVTVFEAGNSGTYVLKPVASESGTDVPIERVGVESDADGLQASVVGNVTAGENVTVRVTHDGEPVENATVTANEDVSVRTDANGTATVAVPADVEAFELKAETAEGSTYGESEAELEVEFGESDDGDAGNDASDDSDVELGAVLEGGLAAGEDATVVVTDGEGEAVEDATVAVDGEVVGETDGNGELTFTVPDDVSIDSEVTVTSDGETITLDATTAAAAN